MTMRTLSALVAMVAATLRADTEPARFVVETHSVHTSRGDLALPVTFKLDSISGNIWRFTGTDFVQIAVARTWSAGVDQGPEVDTEEQRRRAALLKKMNEIVIPEVDLRQANLYDVIEFLHEASVKHDPEKRGVSLIMHVGVSPAQTDGDDPFAETQADAVAEVPLITFKARQITLREALKIVTGIAGLSDRVEGGVVMIAPVCHPDAFANRLYDFLPATEERVRNYRPELLGTNLSPATAEDRWKQYFADFGVTWPAGTSIKPVPFVGKVVVCNTDENLVLFEKVMEAINTYPPRPGRFRLVVAEGASPRTLLLLDSDTGHTWRYDVSDVDGGKRIRSDSFLSIPERQRTSNPGAQTAQ